MLVHVVYMEANYFHAAHAATSSLAAQYYDAFAHGEVGLDFDALECKSEVQNSAGLRNALVEEPVVSEELFDCASVVHQQVLRLEEVDEVLAQ